MADKFDPAAHAENARLLQEQATKARAALQNHIVERNARLGLERDQAARAQYGDEQQRAAAELQAKRELGVAEKADKAAADLERQAAKDARGRGYSEDLREQAGEQRALAEAARRRAHAADQEADRLEMDGWEQKKVVERLEAELKSTDHARSLENEVDNLQWHASNARDMANSAQKVQDLQRQVDAATARGDTVLAAKLKEDLDTRRQIVETVGSVRAQSPIDTKLLGELGVTLTPTVLEVPGFPAPVTAPAQPTSMEESGPPPDQPAEVAAAPGAASDDVLGDATFDDDSTAVAASAAADAPAPDAPTDDVTPIAPDLGDVAATEAFAATDDIVSVPTLDEPTFADASFDQPDPAFENFTEAAPPEFADTGTADVAEMG
jgi:hypothetical protein